MTRKYVLVVAPHIRSSAQPLPELKKVIHTLNVVNLRYFEIEAILICFQCVRKGSKGLLRVT